MIRSRRSENLFIHFPLTAEHQILTLEKRGDMTYFHWEHVPAPGGAPGPPPAGGPPSAQARRPLPGVPRASTAAQGAPGRRALTRVTFQFAYTPDLQPVAQITVAPSSGPPASDPRGPNGAAAPETRP